MDEEHSESLVPEFIRIPKIFYSDATGRPFERCIHCNRSLLSSNVHYVIEKVHKNYPDLDTRDTIFEYALCIDCYMELRKSLSSQSIHNLEEYLNRHVDLIERRKTLIQDKQLNVDQWLSSCIIKNKSLDACAEYQTLCECLGDRMLFTLMPYMVCDDALDEMAQLLSDQTQGFFDDFRQRFLGPSPEFRELLKPSRVLFL